ncbi:MAG: hypothetical protein ABIJ65_10115 [Chloroflexota bacterium]
MRDPASGGGSSDVAGLETRPTMMQCCQQMRRVGYWKRRDRPPQGLETRLTDDAMLSTDAEGWVLETAGSTPQGLETRPMDNAMLSTDAEGWVLETAGSTPSGCVMC